MGKFSKTSERRVVHCDLNQKRFLNFIFDHGELTVRFTGNPTGRVLIETRDRKIVNALRQYLNHKDFSHLRIGKDYLKFKDLLLLLEENKVSFLSNRFLIQKTYDSQELCILNEDHLVLFAIISVDATFNLTEEQKKILKDTTY